MNILESSSLSSKRNCNFYQRKIAQYSPPRNENDERMVRIYKRCLTREQSFLHNLDLIKMIETLHKDAALDLPLISSHPGASTDALDLVELKALLKENS
ncbi:MAG: hypothetical protein P8103_15625 [Candidatus Thiodiazotropha sp.]